MTGLLALALFAAALGLAAGSRRWKALSRVAKQLGLKPVGPRLGKLAGTVQGFKVVATSQELRARVRIDLDPWDRSFWMTIGLRDPSPRSAHEIQSGDPELDPKIRIAGSSDLEVLALLDPAFRHRLAGLPEATSIEVRDGLVSVEGDDLLGESLPSFVDLALDVAARVAKRPSKDAACRVLEQLDPQPGVHKRQLLAVLEAEGAEGERAAELAIASEDLELRIRGGARLGDRGVPALESALKEPNVPPRLALIALETLGRRGMPVVDLMERLVAAVGGSAVAALGRLATPQAEASLIRILRGSSDPEIQRASIEALAPFAQLSSVEALLPLSHGVLGDRRVKRAARAAIAQIQGRHGHGSAGELAIAGADLEEGALSQAPGAGALGEPDSH
jgi:hypothetical protein